MYKRQFPGLPDRYLRGPTGTFFLGLLLIVLTFFLPGGIVYGARKIRARVVQVVPARTVAGGEEVAVASGDSAAGLMSRSGREVLPDPDEGEPVPTGAQQPNQGEPK